MPAISCERSFEEKWIVDRTAPVLVTGAAGFVGSRVVASLLRFGFERILCSVRPSSDLSLLHAAMPVDLSQRCQVIEANLLSRDECRKATAGAEVVYHLVAGRGKSYPSCFQGSAITTRNLLDAVVEHRRVKRFVNVSSFAVYSRFRSRRGSVWDESCPLEDNTGKRYDAYAYGKIKQDELVRAYGDRFGIPFTIVRPGIVFGPGKRAIPGFVGMDTFGFFMHLGGAGRVPLTYVENCADAIVFAGLVCGVEGEVFNVVDDELPTSRAFLSEYKRKVRRFWSVPIPYPVAYALCAWWESYATQSRGQLPPVFNRRMCAFAWKGHDYSNQKLKERLGWQCRVPMKEALSRYFEYQRNA
ncbi:NAD-dependent epimerase/dehydratase family protein [Paludibaculum fermentans]|uniref:NAD-dependent epimerase/dehydratase family protein n=1 Tax=Paludibaculum fermentans TaxID=1473598 RepID=UPI003EBFD658